MTLFSARPKIRDHIRTLVLSRSFTPACVCYVPSGHVFGHWGAFGRKEGDAPTEF